MGKRRFAQVASHDETNDHHNSPLRKRNNFTPKQDEEDEEEEKIETLKEEEEVDDAKPVGEVVRVTGKGNETRRHYNAFEFDGTHYHLEDSIMLSPETESQKPYVAIIKDISVDNNGRVKVMGQWFYRPEDTRKRGGGNWESSDARELFYSFHLDEVPAESVMHKCVVHFIPSNKQVPHRRDYPGFVVQKVYCLQGKRVFKLTDKDYEDDKQEQIDQLVQKTVSILGDLPDIQPQPDQRLISERSLQKDVCRDEEGGVKSGESMKGQTTGTCPAYMSEYGAILFKFNVLTGISHRDKWLEKLLQVVHAVCTSVDGQTDDTSASAQLGITPEDKSKDVVSFCWPDSAVPAVASLENAVHEVFFFDYQKYNQKMRQMTFNLKPNALLSRRLLNGELKPSKILNMTPNELKEGLMAEEMESTQEEESQHLQMTDARCNRCSKKEAGLRDIIQAGRGDRYQLECTNCGHTWYASRDQAATLTIGGSNGPTSVSTAPSARAKSEDAEKALANPCKTEKPAVGCSEENT